MCGNITEWGADLLSQQDITMIWNIPLTFKSGDHHPLWMTPLALAAIYMQSGGKQQIHL